MGNAPSAKEPEQHGEHVWLVPGKRPRATVRIEPDHADWPSFVQPEPDSPVYAEIAAAGPAKLDLSGHGLLSLGRLGGLVELCLSRNKLSWLPGSIWAELPGLQVIKADRNLLQGLPPGIGQLGALRELWLGHNRLRALPSDLPEAGRLQTLQLEHNPELTRIPAGFVGFDSDLHMAVAPGWPERLVLTGNIGLQLPAAEWWKNKESMIEHLAHSKRRTALVLALQAAGVRYYQDLMIDKAMAELALDRTDSEVLAAALESVASPHSTKPDNLSGLPNEIVQQIAAGMSVCARERLGVPLISIEDGYSWAQPRLNKLFDRLSGGENELGPERQVLWLVSGWR